MTSSAATGLLVLGIGLAVGVVAWLVDRRRRTYADHPTTPAAAVFAGRNEVNGRAWVATPLTSHRTGTPSIWWEYVLEEERSHTRTVTDTDSNGHTTSRTETYEEWHEIDRRSGSVLTFEIVDTTGAVEVEMDGASIEPRELRHEVHRDDGERGFFEKVFDDKTGRYRETERAIAMGDEIFVVGEAELDATTAAPILRHTSLISTRSEASRTATLGVVAAGLVLVAVGATGFGSAVAIAPRGLDALGTVVGFAVPALGLLLAWSIITYNRLQLLVQSIERAWSLIDVQLARRDDLIEQLAATVAAHMAHERATVALVTAARPPADDTTTATNERAARQRDALQPMLARGEALPRLRADESFRTLRAAVADTEGRIAASRTFYNDTLSLLKNRSQAFPGVLMAPHLDLGTRELLSDEGFERTVPAVERTFA